MLICVYTEGDTKEKCLLAFGLQPKIRKQSEMKIEHKQEVS